MVVFLICALLAVFTIAVGLWASGGFARPNSGAEGTQPSAYQPDVKASEMTKWDLCFGRKGWAQRRFTLPRN